MHVKNESFPCTKPLPSTRLTRWQVQFSKSSNWHDRDSNPVYQHLLRTPSSSPLSPGFFKGVLGTRFGSLEFQIGSLESEKNIIRLLKSEKIGSLQIHTGFLTFSLKKLT